MPYNPVWTNGNAQGRLIGGTHLVRDDDADEIADAINRRRRLVYLHQQDFSSQVGAGKFVRVATIASQSPPPFRNFRDAITDDIIEPEAGVLGGDPATPAEMHWLWPINDGDENDIIVPNNPQAGQVGLFDKLNGTNNWTDPALSAGTSHVRAVHFNELRQSIEWLRRGRWRLPVYLTAGIFSMYPDTPWIGESIANNGSNELRSVGYAVIRTSETLPRGLINVTVRSNTYFEITADTDCTVEVYHCLRQIDFSSDPPTWNQYDPSGSLDWSTPGGTGQGDSTLLGSINLTANTPGQLSNAAVQSAIQNMIDSAEQNFLIRRSDTGSQTIGISAQIVIEFDLDTPPN